MTEMIFVLCLMMVMYCVNGYTLNEVELLKQQLFTNYSKNIRPIYDQSEPIEVSVHFSLRSIIQFDMSNGQLDTMGYMITYWMDEKLVWDGTQFDDIPQISLAGDELWHPHVAQLNAMADEVQLHSVSLLKDGTVVRVDVRKYYTFCELNMRYFPMDKHECKFEFVSYKYTARDVILVPSTDGADTSLLSKHGEWSVTGTSVTDYYIDLYFNGLSSQPITYTLVLERQPSFNFIHKAIPLLTLAISTNFIHIVPLNSGERISYAVTLFLAFIFWQAVVTDELPKNSSKISVFSILVTTVLCTSGFFTVMSVLLCRLSFLEPDRPIPELLQRLARKLRPKRKHKEVHKRETSQANVIEGNNGANVQRNRQPSSRYSRSTPTNSNGVGEVIHHVTWMEAANAIDTVLFYIHLAICVIGVFSFALIFSLR